MGSGHQARAPWVMRAAEAQPRPQMVNQLVGNDAGRASLSRSTLCLSLPLATQGGGRGRPEGRGRRGRSLRVQASRAIPTGRGCGVTPAEPWAGAA